MKKRPVHLTKLILVLEMEPQTCANQLLPQIATLIGIDLSARIIEELVFDEGAKLRIPIVICAGNNLPREVRVTFSSAAVKCATRALELATSGFGIVNANPGADIRLESSKRESRDEVPHKRTGVNPGSRATASQDITKGIPQREVSAAPEAVVKEIPFNGRPKHTCEKDVTEFDPAKKTDVIFRGDLKSISELIRKSSVSAAVLKDIRSGVNRAVKTESVKFRRRRRGDLFVDLLSGLHRSGYKSEQECCWNKEFFHKRIIIENFFISE
jgi:hypothetical protein